MQSRHPSPDENSDVFHEQALALEERGVDFYILDKADASKNSYRRRRRSDLSPACPSSPELAPGQTEEGTTHGDLRPADTAAQLRQKNVQVIGANCTLGPQALLNILRELTAVDDLRVSGMPNAGLPKREGDRIVYPKSSPEYFALFAREAAALGVRILGGCCGTTPAHIRAMAEAVKSLRPAKSTAAHHSVEVIAKPAPVLQREPESKFWKKLQTREFTVCVEIDPPKGLSLDRIFEQVDKIMASNKVDAIDINSGAMARVGMDALITAGALEARGVETVPHLTTRWDLPTSSACKPCLLGCMDRRRRSQRARCHRRPASRRRLSGNQRRLRSRFRRPR